MQHPAEASPSIRVSSPIPRATPRANAGSLSYRGLICDLIALTCLVLLVDRHTLFEPLMTGKLIIGNDMDQPYNWEAFNRQAFALRELPLWNPYVFSGFPAQADIRTSASLPAPLATASASVGARRVLYVEPGRAPLASSPGTYALCRQIGVSRPAALAAGIG